MSENLRKEKPAKSVGHIVLTVLGVILCIIFLPILVMNTILIIKGAMDDSKPPSVFGYTPLVVLSGSMDDAMENAPPDAEAGRGLYRGMERQSPIAFHTLRS